MKTQLLIGTALFAAISVFAQEQSLKPKPSGIISSRLIMESKYSPVEGVPAQAGPVASPASLHPRPTQRTTAIVNTWQNFTASMNIYGVSNSYVKPLQWNDELNAVTFIHRKSPSYVSSPAASSNAENGTIVTMISTDCGANWDSTAMWVNNTFWGRFPGGAIYNPPGNTNINNAYMVGAGPTTGAGTNVTWTGNWYASKQLGTANYNNAPSTVAGAQQLAQTAGPFLPNVPRHDFSAYGFTATDDGKVRVLAGISDDNLSPVSDTAIMLITGSFNNGIFDWSGQSFQVPVTKTSGGAYNFIPRPMMAWNEAGSIGYIVVMGARKNATGSNTGYQPIVYKTTNSGQSWSLENSIVDFNSPAFSDVKRSLPAISTNTALEVPNFNWGEGMDCAVDANNKLHIFTSILGHPSNHPDSLDFITQFGTQKYLWPHTPGFRPYLYDFIYDGASSSWSHLAIDSMSSESPGAGSTSAGYFYNPWDKDPSQSNRKLRVDARLQMSRTPDGRYLLYTWAESDTAFTDDQVKWNMMPNIKARLLDVQTPELFNYEINVTGDGAGEVASRAMEYFVSPKFQFVSQDNERIVVKAPMTLSNSNPYSQLGPNSHWYACAQLEFLRPMSSDPFNYVGLPENKAGISNSYIYPNPARNNVTVNMSLAQADKVEISVSNAIGQTIRQTQVQGQSGVNTLNIDLSGAAAGIYFITLKVNTSSSTKKLVIE